ncbi:MAG: gamma-glutamyltransferase [Flavobacteriaceae bacterium]|nr:gamma-glutamyltransferase [Flavobacteriaceae bacterium]
MIPKRLLLPLLFVALCSCQNHKYIQARGVIKDSAMVVSARIEASTIGAEILKKGGNVFDAMIGTELALAVCYPYAGNIGGGGFMVYRLADGSTGSLDYRERAPAAAHKDLYLDSSGHYQQDLSKIGGLAVGVPGTIAGLFEVHEKFGSLPIEMLIQPAIDLANNGFVVTEQQAQRINKYGPIIEATSGGSSLYTRPYKTGDTIKNPALAKTFTTIAQKGVDGFYRGPIAQHISSFLQEHRGIIDTTDLANYRAQWRTPITTTFQDLTIISMGPPSSGGICLSQLLGMLEDHDLSTMAHHSSDYIQIIVEAERRAFADRSHYLGDPDFVTVPSAQLLDRDYLQQRMSDFTSEKATPSSEIGYGTLPTYESDETTHYSIVDPKGNAIAVTTTINGGYGAKLFDDDLGFFYNNEMDDFSAKPGTPNMFGLVGGQANAIEPGKRMLSSMTPTIVERDGAFWMSLGTPGGSTIITSVLQVILNTQLFDMPLQQAINEPRFHHQWLPDMVRFEPQRFDSLVLKSLENKGYVIHQKESTIIGKVDAVMRTADGRLEGGADPRGDDAAIGF